jgi:hypothetical protein
MKPKNVRTSVDLPRDLHRRLRQEAARRDCSARQVIVAAIEQAVAPTPPKKGRLKLDRPLLAGKRKPISLTSEEIDELAYGF